MKPNLDKRPIVLRQVEFLANNITRVATVVCEFDFRGPHLYRHHHVHSNTEI